jgi:gamma-glutamyl hydrolase
LTDYHIDTEWRVISVNNDWNDFEFISSIEHRRYPFYGVQFHPEKNLYEWVRNKNISHSFHAIKASQYFAEFFVNEARKSEHHFKDSKSEDKYVIYNYAAQFTGAVGSAFEQSYMFPEEIDYAFGANYANGINLNALTTILCGVMANLLK